VGAIHWKFSEITWHTKTPFVEAKIIFRASPQVLWVYGNGTQYFSKPGLVFLFFFSQTPHENWHCKWSVQIIATRHPLGPTTCLRVYPTINSRYCPLLSLLPASVFIRENVQAQALVLSQNLLSRAIYLAPVELLLGPLYGRSGGQCSTQITHS
jgi:hypothetical protein